MGGEPTMHEALTTWIRLARDLSFDRVSIQTNGRRLSVQEYAAGLVEAGLTHVEISLQGHNASLHDYHTRSPGSFRETAKALLNLRDMQVEVGLTTVVTRSNYRLLEAVAVMSQRVGASAWHVCPAEAIGTALDDRQRVVPNLMMAAPFITRALQRCLESGVSTYMSGMPFCLLSDISALRAVELSDAAGGDRVFVDECERCAERTRCPGVSHAHAEHFGVAELEAIVNRELKDLDVKEVGFPFSGIGEKLSD